MFFDFVFFLLEEKKKNFKGEKIIKIYNEKEKKNFLIRCGNECIPQSLIAIRLFVLRMIIGSRN